MIKPNTPFPLGKMSVKTNKYDIAVAYIGHFRTLLVMSKKILPNNSTVAEITNKFNIAKSDEIGFVEYTGQHVWKYREYIKRNNREEILKIDFRGELDRHMSAQDQDSALARDFLEILLNKAATLADAEWNLIHKTVSHILAEYAKYLQACKALEQAH